MQIHPQRAAQVLAEINKILHNKDDDVFKLRQIWATMAYIRSYDLGNSLSPQLKDCVYSGPFAGMKITPAVKKGPYTSILLGTYETELHNVVERIIATPYQHILNIGCAFGYYSVGLARRMTEVDVYAFDIVEYEQQRCHDMARLNNVEGRVHISGFFQGENFLTYADKRTLVLMDIEGAEQQLLDPALYPALQKMDILVELHDVVDSTLSTMIPERFARTHDIEMIYNQAKTFDFTPLYGANFYVDPFDCLVANWENRFGATPWAYMRIKSN